MQRQMQQQQKNQEKRKNETVIYMSHLLYT